MSLHIDSLCSLDIMTTDPGRSCTLPDKKPGLPDGIARMISSLKSYKCEIFLSSRTFKCSKLLTFNISDVEGDGWAIYNPAALESNLFYFLSHQN